MSLLLVFNYSFTMLGCSDSCPKLLQHFNTSTRLPAATGVPDHVRDELEGMSKDHFEPSQALKSMAYL
jgi:hypothetical protein